MVEQSYNTLSHDGVGKKDDNDKNSIDDFHEEVNATGDDDEFSDDGVEVNEDGDVVEGFIIGKIFKIIFKPIFGFITSGFGFIGKFVMPIISFFLNIAMMAILIGKLAANFVKNPFMTIFKIIMLIGGIMLSIALLLGYIILMLGIAQGIGAVLSYFAATIICSVQTLLLLILWLIATLVFIVIWILNILTGGMLTFLMRCENQPDAWYTQPGYGQGNEYKRFFLCFMPCSSGWKRIFGGVCRKQQKSCPGFCPQQNIYGYFADLQSRARIQPYVFDEHLPDTRFYNMRLDEKQTVILKTLSEKKSFLGSCSSKLSDFDFMNKHICTNLNNLDDKIYTEEHKSRMRAMCRQVFCDFKVSLESGGKPLATEHINSGCTWCKDIAEPPQNESFLGDDAAKEFLVCLLMLIIGTVSCFLILTVHGYMDIPIHTHRLS